MNIASFVGGTYVSPSPLAANERTVNFYVEPLNNPGAKAIGALYPRPGVTEFAAPTLPGVWRASFAENGRFFAVIGTAFVEYDSNGTLTNRGTVALDEYPATICSNGKAGGELGITSGDRFYAFALATNTLTQVLSSGARMCVGIDGYILVLDVTTGTLQQSDLLDALTFDPTNIAKRSMAGDPWVAMAVSTSRRVILLLGEATGEYWSNVGTFPFPFAAQSNGLVAYGTAAPFSLKDVNGIFVWVTQTKAGGSQVVMARGLEPRVVSDHPLAHALRNYITDNRIDDGIADTIEWDGHSFYLVTFPSVNATWVYDTATNVWVEWLTWVSQDNTFIGWRPLYHAFAFDTHLIGDRESSALYKLTQDSALDPDDRPIRCMRRAALPSAQNKRVFIHEIELIHEPGLGVSDPDSQGYDPVVMMRLSYNGGKTWSAERMRKAGKQGEFDERVSWSLCGSGMKPVVEITATDPVPHRWMGLDVTMTGGTQVGR